MTPGGQHVPRLMFSHATSTDIPPGTGMTWCVLATGRAERREVLPCNPRVQGHHLSRLAGPDDAEEGNRWGTALSTPGDDPLLDGAVRRTPGDRHPVQGRNVVSH